jgi:squalene-associated FAD-dependent desaturase
VTLAAAGLPVTLFERAKTLGGRARRIDVDGVALDNGQHVLLGAYRQTLALVDAVHPADVAGGLFHRLPLALRPFGARLPGEIELSAWNARAPLNLAGGVLCAKGLSWRERFALLAAFRKVRNRERHSAADESVAARFAATPRHAFTHVWQPLCLAALNTPPERASADVFAHVLRSAFGGAAHDSDLLVSAADLSASFPDPAARFIAARHGVVRCGATVRSVASANGLVSLGIGSGSEAFAGVIVAVGPHQLASTLGNGAAQPRGLEQCLAHLARFAYESITTIYLGFTYRIPFAVPMLRLDDAPGQWAFDRTATLASGAPPGTKSLIAVVISASGSHDALDQRMLAARVEAQLRRRMPDLPAVTFSRVIAERRATFACTPGLARPRGGRAGGAIYLAGDYCDPELPATLEAATRSGVAAANELIADFAAAAAARGSTRAP